jgi:hypothetical protein
MKKVIALLLAALLCFGTCAVAEETYRVGICQLCSMWRWTRPPRASRTL